MKLGLFGAGASSANLIRALRAGAPFQLWSAHDINSAVRSSLPTGVRFFTDAEAFLEDPALEVVYVASPSRNHVDDAILSGRAAKSVLLEKPAATMLEDYHRLKRETKDKGVCVIVALHSYFGSEVDWSAQHIASDIDQGATVQRMEANFFDPYVDGNLLSARARNLSSSWLDSGPNALSILCKLFPEARIVLAKHQVRMVDQVAVACRGELTVLDPKWGSFNYSLNTDWTQGRNYKDSTISFSDGTVLRIVHTNRSVFSSSKGSPERLLFRSSSPLDRLVEHYVALLSKANRSFVAREDNWHLADRVHLPLLQLI